MAHRAPTSSPRNPSRSTPGLTPRRCSRRAIECYPSPSWFRPEVSAELRAGARGYTGTGEQISNGAGRRPCACRCSARWRSTASGSARVSAGSRWPRPWASSSRRWFSIGSVTRR